MLSGRDTVLSTRGIITAPLAPEVYSLRIVIYILCISYLLCVCVFTYLQNVTKASNRMEEWGGGELRKDN